MAEQVFPLNRKYNLMKSEQEERLHGILKMRIDSLNEPSRHSSKAVSEEFHSLKQKISSLNSKLKSSQSRPSTNKSFLSSLEMSEKEIREIERSISTPARGRSGSLKKELERLKKELVKERKKCNDLKKENASLAKKGTTQTLYKKLNGLMNDYRTLVKSFERSEQIRKKQKEMIEELKRELIEATDQPPKLTKTNKRSKKSFK